MIVDTHVHAFTARDAEHPREVTEVFPAERSEPVPALLAAMERAGVRASVLVSLPGQERYVLEQVAAHRDRLAGVIVLDGRSRWPDERELERWRAAGVRGVRIVDLGAASELAGGPEALRRGLEQAAAHGLLASCYLPGEQLAALDRLVAALRSTTFVLNHSALPRGAADADRWRRPRVAIDWDGRWRDDLLPLLARPNVRVCLSGGYAFCDGDPPYAPVLRWARTLLERCGPERLVLGSDHPWIGAVPGYREELHAFDGLLAELGEGQRRLIEHANSADLYFDSDLL